MSAGRKRVRMQGFEIPVGDVIGLIRWFPLEGEWQHELITGRVIGLADDGRIELMIGDELRQALRDHGWDAGAVRACRTGIAADTPTLW